MKKYKRTIFLLILVAAGAGIWYGFYQYNRKPKDFANVKASAIVSIGELCKSFVDNEKKADSQYLGKAIRLTGKISDIKQDNTGAVLLFSDTVNDITVQCRMDSLHRKEVQQVNIGSSVTLQGQCDGFNRDEMLGSDIFISRCALIGKSE